MRWASPLIHMRRTATQDIDDPRRRRSRPATRSSCGTARATATRSTGATRTSSTSCASPNRHQGFGGGGPHYCLGAALARQMLKALLTEVYTRIPDIEAGEPDFLVANFIHGIKRLPVEWTPEQR